MEATVSPKKSSWRLFVEWGIIPLVFGVALAVFVVLIQDRSDGATPGLSSSAAPHVVSKQKVPDGAIVYMLGQAIKIPTVVTKFSDGSVLSSATASITRSQLRRASKSSAAVPSEADIEHWINNHDPANEGVGPIAGEANEGAATGGDVRARSVQVPETPLCIEQNKDGNDIHLRSCTRYGNGVIRPNGYQYLKAINTTSGWANDSDCSINCDKISSVYAKSSNSAGRLVDWAPDGDYDSGPCSNVTLGVDFYATASTNFTRCAKTQAGLGTRWNAAAWVTPNPCNFCTKAASHLHIEELPPGTGNVFSLEGNVTYNNQ